MGIGESDGPDYEKLELEIQHCSSMEFDLKKLKKPFIIGGYCTRNKKTNVGEIMFQKEETLMHKGDVSCKLTGQTCILYSNYDGVSLRPWPHVKYDNAEKCPSFDDVVTKYRIKGRKKSIEDLHVFNMERIED